jgi:hypothetical protein
MLWPSIPDASSQSISHDMIFFNMLTERHLFGIASQTLSIKVGISQNHSSCTSRKSHICLQARYITFLSWNMSQSGPAPVARVHYFAGFGLYAYMLRLL